MKQRLWGTLALLSMFFLALCAVAQVTSRVTGLVEDKTGAVVTGAKVTLTNAATNISFTTQTTSAGTYVFDGVQPGQYTVTVTMTGFRTFSRTELNVTIGQPTVANARLEVGTASETVEVKGGTDLVQTATSGNIGNLMDQVSVTTLPLVGTRGRNPLELVELQPGVVDGGGFNQQGPNVAGGGVHVNGARDRAWNYTLDGIDINETSAGGSNFAPLRTNPDSIAEFRVMTSNFTSEYGRNSGAQVEMVTRSGTNEFHGTGFFFYQTPALMANDPANKAATPPLPRPQWVQKIPGFSIGGPIQKNKTFFFTNFQWLRTLRTVPTSSTVYTDSARKGIFRYVTTGRNLPAGTPGASVDTSGNVASGVAVANYDINANSGGIGLDPTVQKLLGMTPTPNNFKVGDGLNTAGFDWIAPEHEKQLDMTVKVDHVFNDKHMVFFRWAQGHQNTECDTVNAGLAPFPGAPCVVDTYRTPKNFAFNWRWTINPRLLNEFVAGMNRFSFDFANPDKNYQQNPPFYFNNVTIPLQNYVGNKRVLTTIQLVDNMSWTRGPHTFKWGANLRYQRHIDDRGSIGNLDAAPAVFFDVADAPVDATAFNLPTTVMNGKYDLPMLQATINDLLGRVGEIDQGFVSKDVNTWQPIWTHLHNDFRMPEYDFYFQDSWRIRHNLVIDAGLRWEIRLSPRVTHPDMMLRPDQPFGWDVTPSNTLRWVPGALYKDSLRNFGPSIGFAWDPWSDGKTSLRGNYRLAYDRMNTFSLSSGVFQNLPGRSFQSFNYDGTYLARNITSGFLNTLLQPTETPGELRQPASFGRTAGITVVDPNWQPPQTHMWSLGIQRDLGHGLIMEMNYLGRRAYHLYGGYDANQVDILKNGFLDAFKVVEAGGESPLINQLLSGDSRNTSGLTGSAWMRDPGSPYYSAFSLGSVAGVAQAMAQRSQSGTPLVVADGLSPYFFMAYPQFAGRFNVLDSAQFSTYHALQTQVRRNFSNGVTFQASYVWSKSLDSGSFDPTFTQVARGSSLWGASSTPFDLHNRKLNYAPSDFDRTHVFQANWVYELPFGKGRHWGQSWNGALERILGGWEIGGFGTIESGRPFTVWSPAYTVSSVVRTPADCASCSPSMFQMVRDTAGNLSYVTPEQIAQFSTPGPGQFSNVGRNFFRLNGYRNVNIAIGKKTRITERQTLETRLEIQNLTNSIQFDAPATGLYTSGSFGQLDPQVLSDFGVGLSSDPRKMQISVKYSF